MIRNVVLHLQGELPMKADIESLPTAADVGLLCTNLRTMEGRKPLSTEFLDSVFLIPFAIVRFLEIPREAIDQAAPADGQRQIPAASIVSEREEAIVVAPAPRSSAPRVGEPASQATGQEIPLEDLEPDEDLLRRIREA